MYGDTQEDLFVNAAVGLANVMRSDADKLVKRSRGHKKIKVEAQDQSSLLVDFLNEILSESNIEGKIFPRVKILRISSKLVEAQIFGVGVDGFEEDVKAVSYHNVEIEKKGDKLQATLVLDI